MEKPGGLDFKVGQLAEMRTFKLGYRGAWFRCKIKDINLEKKKVLPEYYEFEPEGLKWEKIYQVPPYGMRLKHIKKQLMVRPEYPVVYHKSEMPPASSISQTCVVIDGTWKVGDLVDWCEGDCFWSARVVKVLSDDKVQIEWPMPPLGEWKEGENERQEVFCKDLRPFLDWSETEGWTFPTVDGQTACDAQLIFPTNQVESSESNLSLCVGKREVADEEVENIMHEHTLDAAIVGLEELVNKVKWLQRILQSPSKDATTTSSWKFA